MGGYDKQKINQNDLREKQTNTNTMSERNFFNIRYALPGYTFILIMILVANPVIIETLVGLTEVHFLITAFIAFFTLLSGGAIGFLISQVYYFFHNSCFNRFSLLDTRKFLKKEFKLVDNTHQEVVFLDYLFHQSDERTINYVTRRFDLQHTFGSTLFAIGFGVIFGIYFKIDFLVANSSYDFFELLFCPTLTMNDAEVIAVICGLLFVFVMGYRFVRQEHAMMVDIAVKKVYYSKYNSDKGEAEKVKEVEYNRDEIKKIFSEKKYFKKKVPN